MPFGVRLVVMAVVLSVCGAVGSVAWGAVTPGWECVPTAAGTPVESGGTGATPDCSATPGSTAVLAPTYLSSGVGGKPTVQFASVNVQILNGSGSTASVNGEGNLVLGYDESPGTQTGSHDLILGKNQSYSGYADLLDGQKNSAGGNYGLAVGYANSLKSSYSTVLGADNTANATAGDTLGGLFNTVTSSYGTVAGGCSNVAGLGKVSLSSDCNSSRYPHSFASVSGGAANQATGMDSSVTAGQYNLASDPFASIAGGCDNVAGAGTFLGPSCTTGSGWEAVLGGGINRASGADGSISGGAGNTASGDFAAVSGGDSNTAQGGGAQVNGGRFNTAAAQDSSVEGGIYNASTDSDGSILGGCLNATGDGDNPQSGSTCPTTGPAFNTVSGGKSNRAGASPSSFGNAILAGSRSR